jgi:lipopolysaccharide export system protein LptA
MSSHEAFMNIIHREVTRVVHRLTRRTPAIVSAYDPKTYACKFKLMPDSMDQVVETGWIPLGTSKSAIMQQGGSTSAGSGTGGALGGSGGAAPGSNQNQQPYGNHMPPEIGEQGWLEFHEHDREAATFTHSSFNDQAPPVMTQAGEWQYVSPWGHTFYHKQDGSLTIKSGNQQQNQSAQQSGSTIGSNVTSSQGSSKLPAKQVTIFCDNKGNMTITLQGDQGDGTMGTLTVNAMGDINHNAQGNVSVTAGNGKNITFTAQTGKIIHQAQAVYLGDANATRLVGLHGTVDTAGHGLVSNLATKVFGI